MRAYVLTRFGGPEALAWREDWPDPEPAADEVVVRVGATGLNNTDIWTRQGSYGADNGDTARRGWREDAFAFPRIQGADVVGRIVRVGAAVPAARIGERVMLNPVLNASGPDAVIGTDYLGSEKDGGFAEFCAVPSENAVRIEAGLSDAELATFATAYLTAEHMLNRTRLLPGETILISGASGGVGSALIQLAKLREARVVAIAGAAKREAVRRLGADLTVDRGSGSLAADIRHALSGGPIDVFADVVVGPSMPPLLGLLREGGRYVVAGAIGGPLVELDMRTIYLRHLEVIGSTLGTPREFHALIDHIAHGRLRPLLAGTYRLADLPAAQLAFGAKSFVGKLVVTNDAEG